MDAVDAAEKPLPFTRSLSHHQTFTLPFRKTLAVVIYTTSLRSVRRAHADCCAVRAIFRGLRVAVDERDVSIHAAFRRELQTLAGSKSRPPALPQVFLRGKRVGGAEEVRRIHEAGEMGRLLEGVQGQDPAFVCGGCGGAGFVPCRNCRGSRKVFVEEEEGGRRRRCEDCNENGLIRCAGCFALSFD